MKPFDRFHPGLLVGPAVRICVRWGRWRLKAAMTLTVPGLVNAEPEPAPNSLAALIADAGTGQLNRPRMWAKIQAEQESVKAILMWRRRGEAATTAQQQVDERRRSRPPTLRSPMPSRFDTSAVATYVNGPASSLILAGNPDEMIWRCCRSGNGAPKPSTQVSTTPTARTEQVNCELAARLAKEKADQAVSAAEASNAGCFGVDGRSADLPHAQTEIDWLAAERKTARRSSTPRPLWPYPAAAPPPPQAAGPAAAGSGIVGTRRHFRHLGRTVKRQGGSVRQVDRMGPDAAGRPPFVSGDPIQIINAILQISGELAAGHPAVG